MKWILNLIMLQVLAVIVMVLFIPLYIIMTFRGQVNTNWFWTDNHKIGA